MQTVFLPNKDRHSELSISALVLGNFDGVHKGHQRLFDEASDINLKAVGEEPLSWALMTFEPHPKEFFENEGFKRVFSPKDGLSSLEKAGLKLCLIHDFNESLSSKTPKEFLDEVVLKVKPRAIVVGEDFYFGKSREGSVDDIIKWAKPYGIEISVIKLLKQTDGVKISSTFIRSLLHKGEVKRANEFLLSPFFMSGGVKREKGLATQLGFPTINAFPENDSNLKLGVYCSRSKLLGDYYNSITNFGVRPTVEGVKTVVMETHLLNFPEKLIGVEFDDIEVEFLDFVRPESRFADIIELKLQIKKDLEKSKKFFE